MKPLVPSVWLGSNSDLEVEPFGPLAREILFEKLTGTDGIATGSDQSRLQQLIERLTMPEGDDKSSMGYSAQTAALLSMHRVGPSVSCTARMNPFTQPNSYLSDGWRIGDSTDPLVTSLL